MEQEKKNLFETVHELKYVSVQNIYNHAFCRTDILRDILELSNSDNITYYNQDVRHMLHTDFVVFKFSPVVASLVRARREPCCASNIHSSLNKITSNNFEKVPIMLHLQYNS